MGLFRREPKGRHALGAAVTSIPSGPLQGFLPPPPVQAPSVAAAPAPVVVPADVVPAAEPDLMTSIAELIATGEAWSTDPAVLDELPTLLSPPVEQVPVPPVVAEPLPPAVAPVAAPAVVPAPTAPARSSLDAALAELLPLQVTPEPAAAPAPRVQLGFRDGTSTTLDPSSSQAQALEELAQSLTRRD